MLNYNYISIPRTASQSIRQALQYKPNNHRGITKFNKAYSFTFFREPIDRLQSWFFWHKRSIQLYNTTFNKWVELGCPHHWTDGLLKESGIKNPLNQWEYIVIDNKIAVDFIGDFRHLRRDFKKVCNIIGASRVPLPKISISNKTNEVLTPANRSYLEKRFNRDFHIYANKLSNKCCGQ